MEGTAGLSTGQRCQAHLRAGDSKVLESLSHPKEAALGKDMEEAQGITVSKIQEWEGRG